MSDTRYSTDHQWIRPAGDGKATVGITDYAQQQLGDVVYVELPEVGRSLAAGDVVCIVESVKAASDVHAPAAGTVVAVNGRLAEAPELVNAAPEGEGWFLVLRLRDAGELQGLMSADQYATYLARQA